MSSGRVRSRTGPAPTWQSSVPEPWEDYETGDIFGADHIYSGEREVLEDLVLLTETCLAFELWADDFRYWDRLESRIPVSQWEELSLYSESASIQMSMAPNRD